jgi:hypothetical protein
MKRYLSETITSISGKINSVTKNFTIPAKQNIKNVYVSNNLTPTVSGRLNSSIEIKLSSYFFTPSQDLIINFKETFSLPMEFSTTKNGTLTVIVSADNETHNNSDAIVSTILIELDQIEIVQPISDDFNDEDGFTFPSDIYQKIKIPIKGGKEPYTFSLDTENGDDVPNGLLINGDSLEGTPENGNSTLIFIVTDSYGNTHTSNNCQMNFVALPNKNGEIAFTKDVLGSILLSSYFSDTDFLIEPKYTLIGLLPTGLIYDGNETISGTPTEIGTWNLTVNLNDARQIISFGIRITVS